MEYKFVDGKFVDVETGEPVSAEAYQSIKETLGWMDKNEYEKGVSTALNRRAESLAEKKLEERLQEKMKELNANKNATEEEKRILQEQIDHLKKEKMTAEERAKAQFEEQLQDYQNKVQMTQKQYADLEKRYRDERASSRLAGLASQHKALESDVVVSLIRQNEEWIETQNEKGETVVVQKYRMPVYDATTQEEKMTLVDPETAMDILVKKKAYLFESSNRNGLGSHNFISGEISENMSVDAIHQKFYGRK